MSQERALRGHLAGRLGTNARSKALALCKLQNVHKGNLGDVEEGKVYRLNQKLSVNKQTKMKRLTYHIITSAPTCQFIVILPDFSGSSKK